MEKVESTEKTEAEVVARRNFRNNTDLEYFYRFVYENNLRAEAHKILNVVTTALKKQSKRKKIKLQ